MNTKLLSLGLDNDPDSYLVRTSFGDLTLANVGWSTQSRARQELECYMKGACLVVLFVSTTLNTKE